MKKKHFKIDTNNDFVKLYIRLLKEENLYGYNDFLSNDRYDEIMEDYYRCYKENTIKWIIGIPDLLIKSNTSYDDYYNIHSKYVNLLIDDMIISVLKIIYQILPSDELKSLLNKNRKLIKKDIKHHYLLKVNKRNISGSFLRAFTYTIHNILSKYNINHKLITPQRLNNVLTHKRKYKLIKKN